MRILFLNDYPFFLGGAEIYAHSLSEHLSKLGHPVRWLTTSSRGGGPLAAVAPSLVPFHDDDFCFGISQNARAARAAVQFWNPFAQAAVEKSIWEWQPDIVHLHGYLGQLSPSILRPLSAIPTVATLHTYKEVCPKGTKQRPDQSVCLTKFGSHCKKSGCLSHLEYLHESGKRSLRPPHSPISLFLAPSEFVRDLVSNQLEAPVRHIPYATDFRKFKRPKENGNGDLLFVGRLSPSKGVDRLLEEFSFVVRDIPHASLTIAGSGPERFRLELLARVLGIGDRVLWLGDCDRYQLAELYSRCDGLVVPSLWPEVSGIVAMEAIVSGTPVLASEVGGLKEIVRPGVTGEWVRPQAEGELANAMRRLISDGDYRRRLERGCEAEAEQFDMEESASQLVSVYTEVIASRNKAT